MSRRADDQAEVERLTNVVIRVLNEHDFQYADADGKELLKHLAPDFEAVYDNDPCALDFAGQTALWQRQTRENPDLHCSVLNMTTRVQTRSQTATVYLKLGFTGVDGVQMQGACKLDWRVSEGQWLLCRHINMRGPLLDGLWF